MGVADDVTSRSRGIAGYDALVANALDKLDKQDFEEALRSITSTIGKCVKAKPRLKRGSPQHTLLVRRLKALRIAAALIKRQLDLQRGLPPKTRKPRIPTRKPRLRRVTG